ncbi:hypothetical protein [Halobacteriovorax sp. DA5]|uniref:hypothetical protein n=1 Tax=Halobacteriovorax sp. DA5 TaxID=2067553 RepID=UPI000CD29168|nr:hypothetical protein [Halobacteriovorax sp. DA5]POB13872.1 hypothetical protein C0Z22_07370 [Halobacteriovorax sp. DA5]
MRVRVSPRAPTLYRLTFSNLDSQTSEKTLIDYTANLLFLHHEELTGLDQRVQDGKILESDLFFLKRFIPDMCSMKTNYKFRFIQSA